MAADPRNGKADVIQPFAADVPFPHSQGAPYHHTHHTEGLLSPCSKSHPLGLTSHGLIIAKSLTNVLLCLVLTSG